MEVTMKWIFNAKALCAALGFMACCGVAAAQGARGGSAGTSQPAPNSTNPNNSYDANNSNNLNRLLTEGRPGDYFTGKVALASGALPWDPITVTMACNGADRLTTATDAKGAFVIAAPNSGGAAPTQDAKPKFGNETIGCTVQAHLAGFESSTLTISNRNVQDTPDVGTISLKREAGAEGAGLSSTTAAAPKDAVKAFEKARGEWLDKKPDRAQKDLEKAVQVYPQFAEAWYQLGKIQQDAKSADAYNSFSKAAAADPKFSLPYEHMAQLAVQSQKWDDLAGTTAHALELNPQGSAWLWYYDALGNYKLGKADRAESSATKALAADPQHQVLVTEQLLAVILAGKGDSAGALAHLKNSLTYLPPGPNADLVKQQVAQLEKAAPPPSK
jgi:tetratricopeptide (TPR) repeat protein